MKVLLRIAFVLLALLPTMAGAVNPGEMLADPALEERARAISAELRCLVCQNQSIDDSDADLAHDLRVLVRERLVAGDSDEQVRQFVVARYGEFVLLRPVIAAHTIILWIAAPVLLLAGLLAIVLGLRRRRATPEQRELTAEEHEALLSLEDSRQGE